MNFHVFAPKYPISAQFGYNFSRQTDSGAGIACFRLVTSLLASLQTVLKVDSIIIIINARKLVDQEIIKVVM